MASHAHAHASRGDINLRSGMGRALVVIWTLLGVATLAWLVLLGANNGAVGLLHDFARALVADTHADWLLGVALGMLAVVAAVAHVRGVLGVIGSAIGLPLILCIVVPALANGLPGYLVAPPVAAFMVFVAIVLTYGWKEFGIGVAATVAVCGCLAVLTAVACWVLTSSGLGSDAEVTAAVLTGAAAMIDIAATQVSTVRELAAGGADKILRRALRVGKDHLVSMIHTFTMAVFGVAVPALLVVLDHAGRDAILGMVAALKPELVVVALVTGGLAVVIPASTLLAWWLCRHDASHAAHGEAAGT